MSRRIISCQVTDEYVRGAGVVVGAAGSHNDVAIRLSFSNMWNGTTKSIVWKDALGGNPTVTILGTNLLETGETDVYLVPIPAEPKAYAGEMSMTIKGAVVVGDKETSATLTARAVFTVMENDWDEDAVESGDITPTQAEQFQTHLEAIKADIEKNAENSALEAKSWAVGGTGTRDGENQDNARFYADQAYQAHDRADDCARVAEGLAIRSESWAVGGTGFRGGEDTDNAKYYAKKAGDSEQRASDSERDAASSAQAAAESAGAAAESASAAAISEANASTSAKNASTDADFAATSAKAAAKAQDQAEASAKASAGSAEAAASAQEQAEASKISAMRSERNAKAWAEGGQIIRDVNGLLIPTTVSGAQDYAGLAARLADDAGEFAKTAEEARNAILNLAVDGETVAPESTLPAVEKRLLEDGSVQLYFRPRRGDSGVYVGSGEMPAGCNVQIDPDGDGWTGYPAAAETVDALPEADAACLGRLVILTGGETDKVYICMRVAGKLQWFELGARKAVLGEMTL